MSKRAAAHTRGYDNGGDEEMRDPTAATPKPRRSAGKALLEKEEEEAQCATPLKQGEVASRTLLEAMKTPKVVKQKQRRRDNDAVYLSAFGIQVPAQKKKWIGKRKSDERDTDSPRTKGMITMLSTVSLNTPPPLKKVKRNLVLESHTEMAAVVDNCVDKDEGEDENSDDDFLSCENWSDDDDEEESDEEGVLGRAGRASGDESDSFGEFQRKRGAAGFAMSTPSPVKKSPHSAFLMRQNTPEGGRERTGRRGCFISPISSATATPITGRGGKEREKERTRKYTKEVRDKYDNYLLEMSFSTNGTIGDDDDGDSGFLGIDEWYEKIYKKGSM